MKFVYALRDPRNNEIKYIGVTANLSRRLQQHRMARSPVGEWIRSTGVVPSIDVLDSFQVHAEAYRREGSLINLLAPPLNVNAGHYTTITVRFSRAMVKTLRDVAAAEGTTVSKLIRLSINQFLAQQKIS